MTSYRRILFVSLSLTVLLLAVGTLAGACDGDDGLTLEEYFQQVETLDEELDERVEALEFTEEFASEEEDTLAFQGYFAAGVPILAEFVDALDDLDPPAEIEDAHEEVVDSGRDFVTEYEELVNELLADAGPSSALSLRAFDNPEYEAASDRFLHACFALQDIADANGIEVDLTCR